MKLRLSLLFSLVVSFSGASDLWAVEPATYSRVYCSRAQEKVIGLLELDLASGSLRKVDEQSLPAEPGALASSPGGRFLFACLRSSGQLASFRIDSLTGRLTAINVVEAGADPAQISVDASGNYLLAAYYVAAKVTVHRIAADGSLSEQPVQTLPTADKAHAIVPDRSNRFAYVPHTGPNLIYQFGWDAGAGRLTPLDPLRLERPANTGPRHLAWHPQLPIAYVDNEQGSSMTAYSMQANGTLAPGQSATTLPADFRRDNSTAEIKVHPNGRTLYVSNRGHDSIAVIGIDPMGTQLTFIAAEPTEKTPRSFDLDPSGKYLLAAGESSGKLAVYRIAEDTGRLQLLSTTEIGPMLWWVQVVQPQ